MEINWQVIKGGEQEFLWAPDGTTFFMPVEGNNTLYVGDSYGDNLSFIVSNVGEMNWIR